MSMLVNRKQTICYVYSCTNKDKTKKKGVFLPYSARNKVLNLQLRIIALSLRIGTVVKYHTEQSGWQLSIWKEITQT